VRKLSRSARTVSSAIACIVLGASTGLSFATPSTAAESNRATGIGWVDWSEAAFQKAKKENKPVILDLEAVWCHWCHVMDGKTYSNPVIANLIKSQLVAIRVDQDNRPDLSTRYQDYGWPATIIFSPSGKEIVKRAGYIAPGEMLSLLNDVIKAPNQTRLSERDQTKVAYGSSSTLSAALKKELTERSVEGFDTAHGGWGSGNHFLDWDTVEYCMTRARQKDKQNERMAKATIAGEQKLIDPIWGGVYQYSTDGGWGRPHFEKIMQMQSENMRIFSLAYDTWHDNAYLKGATDIERFLKQFLLSPDGAFYTSMDADLVPGEHSGEYFKLGDEARRKLGVPKIDKHIYARENGWAINGLVALYGATGDDQYLKEATRAADWVMANRALPGGGFSHDKQDQAGPFLDDSLAMARAFLSLYGATGDRKWYSRAEETAGFIDAHFKFVTHTAATKKSAASTIAAGYADSDVTKKSVVGPIPNVDQNVMVARFSNLLYQYSGNERDKKMSETAMRFLATPEVGRNLGIYTAGILLADFEVANAPTHITIVGPKDDPNAKALMLAAVKYPSGYKVVEWWDKREGPLPHMDVEFPDLEKAAAFGCASQRCSAPVYTPDKLNATVDGLANQ